ncbi:PEGA domain-containing protein [Myxococcota bacterium]|nr:PEGA domain-containing protein [Myxococcota bacterium]
MASRGTVAGVAALVVASVVPLDATAKDAGKVAWIGVARGPLAPAHGALLESLVLDELDGYDSFRIVDAGGGTLDDRLLGAEAARMSKLVDEAVDHLLHFRAKQALERVDAAIQIFESRLLPLSDYELLHEALVVRAEALAELGKGGAAVEALKSLAALSPKKPPSKKTHAPKIVELWERATAEKPRLGVLRVQVAEPGATISVDGKALGRAPVEVPKLPPGRHYVVARWSSSIVLEAVQLGAGRELTVELARRGPAEEARRGILDVIDARTGADRAIALAKRVRELSSADDVLVAGVRAEAKGPMLHLARHGAAGRIEAVVRVPIPASADGEGTAIAVRRAAAAMFVDRRTGFVDITDAGDARLGSELAAALYGKAASGAVTLAPATAADWARAKDADDAADLPMGDASVAPDDAPALVREAPRTDDDGGVTSAWWFWAALGAVVVAGAAVGGAVLLAPDPTTTTLQLDLPPGGGR